MRNSPGRSNKLHPAPGRRYATYAQAADYIGCAKRTVQNMVEDGRLTVYRLTGRVVRVDLNEVDAIMAGAA